MTFRLNSLGLAAFSTTVLIQQSVDHNVGMNDLWISSHGNYCKQDI
ncbi:hypothetical protein N9K60_05050 [Candidatus Poseidoniales archaeon]|nr:hypothetical protein [Candidatus Poseidoniales archaeon]